MGVLAEIQQDIERVVERAGGAVVGIGQRWGAGSGIVVAEGRVLTNAHNVHGETVTVTFTDGRTSEGRVIGTNIDKDLAMVEVSTEDSAVITWANESPGMGTPVFALANPAGRGLRVTLGFVTSVQRSFRGPRGRRITGTIEHGAPLPPGSSGGPIVTAEGQLLGVNTHRLGEGFYLAIPADASLSEHVNALTEGKTATRPRLGIGVAPGHVARGLRRAVGLPEADGILIRQVEEASPASRAGLAEGDLIVSAAGRPVRGIDDLFDALDTANDGQVEVAVLRGTEERTITVRLG